jgi:hypothetical protein
MTTSPTYEQSAPTAGNIIRPSWMTDEMYMVWLDHYLDAGGDGVENAAARATALFRDDPRYGTKWFPGIKAEDGQIRFANAPEETYASNMRAYRNIVQDAGMNPDMFADEYVDLIVGETSPNEFSSRVNALEERVMSQGPAIRDFYAMNYGLDMSSEGILAGLMSSRVNDAILSRQITMAEIAGEGISRGFDIGAEFANMLASEADMDRGEAMRMFGSAERMLPLLNALAVRHGDPDDDFDIYEFAQGYAMGDAEQTARFRSLEASESSMFTGGAQINIVRDRQGGARGLEEL